MGTESLEILENLPKEFTKELLKEFSDELLGVFLDNSRGIPEGIPGETPVELLV